MMMHKEGGIDVEHVSWGYHFTSFDAANTNMYIPLIRQKCRIPFILICKETVFELIYNFSIVTPFNFQKYILPHIH